MTLSWTLACMIAKSQDDQIDPGLQSTLRNVISREFAAYQALDAQAVNGLYAKSANMNANFDLFRKWKGGVKKELYWKGYASSAEAVVAAESTVDYKLAPGPWNPVSLLPYSLHQTSTFIRRYRFVREDDHWLIASTNEDPLVVASGDGLANKSQNLWAAPDDATRQEILNSLDPEAQGVIFNALYTRLWSGQLTPENAARIRNTVDYMATKSSMPYRDEVWASVRAQEKLNARHFREAAAAFHPLPDAYQKAGRNDYANWSRDREVTACLWGYESQSGLTLQTAIESQEQDKSPELKYQFAFRRCVLQTRCGQISQALASANEMEVQAADLKDARLQAVAALLKANDLLLDGELASGQEELKNSRTYALATKDTRLLALVDAAACVLFSESGAFSKAVSSGLSFEAQFGTVGTVISQIGMQAERFASQQGMTMSNMSSMFGFTADFASGLLSMPTLAQMPENDTLWWWRDLLAEAQSWTSLPTFLCRLTRIEDRPRDKFLSYLHSPSNAPLAALEQSEFEIQRQQAKAGAGFNGLSDQESMLSEPGGLEAADKAVKDIAESATCWQVKSASDYIRSGYWLDLNPQRALESALAGLREPLYPVQKIRMYTAAGLAYRALKKNSEAISEFRKATGLIDSVRDLAGEPDARLNVAETFSSVYTELASCLAESGDLSAAWVAADSAKARTAFDGVVNHGAAEQPVLDSTDSDWLKELQRREDQSLADFEKSRGRVDLSDEDRDGFVYKLDEARWGRLLFLEGKRAVIRPTKAALDSQVVMAADLAAEISKTSPKACVLQYYFTKKGLECLVLKVGQTPVIKSFILPIERTKFLQDVAACQIICGRPATGKPPRTADSTARRPDSDVVADPEALNRVVKALLDPLRDTLVGCDHLVILADGPIHLVPFQSLEWNGELLSEMFFLSTAPSGSVLKALLSEPPKTDWSDVEVIGGLTYADGVPPLDYADDEVQKIGEAFKVSPTTKRAASLRSVIEKLQKADLLHFATHGSVDRLPPYSALYLSATDQGSNDLLTVEKIRTTPVRASLVTLSACSTGVGLVTEGEQPLSVGWAFLSSGAKCVLMTQWLLDDAAGSTLAQTFYNSLERNKSQPLAKLIALREAERAVRSQGGAKAAPYAWSPYVLCGDWR